MRVRGRLHSQHGWHLQCLVSPEIKSVRRIRWADPVCGADARTVLAEGVCGLLPKPEATAVSLTGAKEPYMHDSRQKQAFA